MRKRISAIGAVSLHDNACNLVGFFVASTTGGTIVVRDGGAAGEQLTGTITPNAGQWYDLPLECRQSLHVTIGGTALDVTFVYG